MFWSYKVNYECSDHLYISLSLKPFMPLLFDVVAVAKVATVFRCC